jgi:hypothetical protein
LLIVTFDENDDKDRYHGLTNPLVDPGSTYPPVGKHNQHLLDIQNRLLPFSPALRSSRASNRTVFRLIGRRVSRPGRRRW